MAALLSICDGRLRTSRQASRRHKILKGGEMLHRFVDTDIDRVTRAVALRSGILSNDWTYDRHQHRKSQLLYSQRGILCCETANTVWLVPPGCALWIPGQLAHSARGAGLVECHCLYIEPSAAKSLPKTCCTISISPLIRELILRVAELPECYPLGGREDRLVMTLLDELSEAPTSSLNLPMPREARLRRLAEMLIADPSAKTSFANWASALGMSERTLSRLLLQEIGMSFGRWRHQLHVILAVQRIASGESVKTVALELGYENASSFVNMFRKTLGKPPVRYLTEHRAILVSG
ncbi:AraC family transcriptional regulator [Bradyrhizobium sp. CCBAU 45384]|uniref:AraC family transcriptional regulator n=1 Tax=Bradyrhizobium sp. CCBAU 45384 TaxID=858428 RepID=UPI002305CDEA|nr:helix-turn-helix transcriptional regulator [Bradyrhizobium sp. CCBAU 45384]